jgi:hypothetical protein
MCMNEVLSKPVRSSVLSLGHAMAGGVKAHEVSSSSHTPPPARVLGVKCEHTTRSSFIHSAWVSRMHMRKKGACCSIRPAAGVKPRN